jgi:hypothetical protein
MCPVDKTKIRWFLPHGERSAVEEVSNCTKNGCEPDSDCKDQFLISGDRGEFEYFEKHCCGHCGPDWMHRWCTAQLTEQELQHRQKQGLCTGMFVSNYGAPIDCNCAHCVPNNLCGDYILNAPFFASSCCGRCGIKWLEHWCHSALMLSRDRRVPDICIHREIDAPLSTWHSIKNQLEILEKDLHFGVCNYCIGCEPNYGCSDRVAALNPEFYNSSCCGRCGQQFRKEYCRLHTTDRLFCEDQNFAKIESVMPAIPVLWLIFFLALIMICMSALIMFARKNALASNTVAIAMGVAAVYQNLAQKFF